MGQGKLATSFDRVAGEYDKWRGGYPDEVFDDLIRISGVLSADMTACEIGCGTGQATVGFATRGAAVLCVEPGPALLVRARTNLASFNRVEFVEARFEDAAVPEGRFDLVYAAQSFHWVDAKVAHILVARALKPCGLFATFWQRNFPSSDPLTRALDDLFTAFLPDYRPSTISHYEREALGDLETLVSSDQFYGCQLRRYPISAAQQTTTEYAGVLGTWSAVAVLPAPLREELLDRVREVIERSGGLVPGRRSEVILLCGHRRGTNGAGPE